MAQTAAPTPAQVANFPASINGANAYNNSRDLLLKTFGGEVLKHFDEKFSLKDKIRTRTISGGKTAQFPGIGQAKAEHFVPGQEIVGQAMKTDEKTISINDFLVSSVFLNNIDEMLTHFEFRAEYSKQMAQALALTCERTLFQMAIRDARLGDQFNAAQVPGAPGVTATGAASGAGKGIVDMENAVTKHVGTGAGAAELVTSAFEAAAYFDEHDIPMDGRHLYVSPRTYYSLINQNDKTIINSDFSAGNGNYGDAVVYKIAGFNIVPTNHLAINGTANSNTGPDSRTPLNAPNGADAGVPTDGFGQDYAVDASDNLGLFMHTEGLGMVKLQDLTTESEYSVAKQGTLLVSKLLMGAATLRPDCLYEVRKAADV